MLKIRINNQIKALGFCLIIYAFTALTGFCQDYNYKWHNNVKQDIHHFDAKIYDSISPIYFEDVYSHFPYYDANINNKITNQRFDLYEYGHGSHKKSIYSSASIATNVLPGLLTTNSFAFSLGLKQNNFDFSIGVSMNKYFFQGIEEQFGVSSNLDVYISQNLRATLFANLYNTNPYYTKASYPYVDASKYGGYMSYQNSNFRLDLGVERKFDPITRQWYTTPIVTPSVKISKIQIGLPVGELLRALLYDLSRKRRK